MFKKLMEQCRDNPLEGLCGLSLALLCLVAAVCGIVITVGVICGA